MGGKTKTRFFIISFLYLSRRDEAFGLQRAAEAIANGLGYIKKSKMEHTVNLANELHKHDPPVKVEDVYTKQFIKKIPLPANFKRWSQR